MNLITRVVRRIKRELTPSPRRLFYRFPRNFTLSAQEQQLVDHVKESIAKAQCKTSNLSDDVFKVDGMSSPKVRCLLNNICSLPQCSYLEIGCLKGSTFISALYQNKNIIEAHAVDDWSQFGGTKQEFIDNTSRLLPRDIYPYHMHEQDCFTLDTKKIFAHPINVYFYDGNHDAWAQEKAFTYFNSSLDNLFVAIIDDWNWDDARRGTMQAFKKLNYDVLFEQELPAARFADMEQWYCGIYVAVIRKQAKI